MEKEPVVDTILMQWNQKNTGNHEEKEGTI